MIVRPIRNKKKADHWQLFLLTLPGILVLFVFSYLPMAGIILPFKNYRYDLGIFKSPWVGWMNFKFLFSTDNAIRITRNVLVMNSLFIITVTFTAIVFALVLNELSKKFVKLYQTVLFVPYFISWVVASYIVFALLDMDYGFLNNILVTLGADPITWYNEPQYWPVILTIANLWKGAGYTTVIYYAGLMGIDREFYEAARIDGASKMQQIRHISVPLITPLILMIFILSIGKIFFGNFDLFYNVTRDSPMLYSTTDVIDTFVYRSLKTSGDIGMASAAGLYQSVVGFVIVLSANFIVKRINPDNSIF